jgi:hypothetical protein
MAKHKFKKAFKKTVEFLGDKERHEKIRRNLGEAGKTLSNVEHGIDDVFGIPKNTPQNTLTSMREGVVRTLPRPKPRKLGRVVVRRHPAEFDMYW